MTARACRVLALGALTLALVAAPADAKLKPPPPGKALGALVRQTKALPRAAAPKARKRKLVRLAVSAKRAAKRRPCRSVRRLAGYRRLIGRTKVRKRRRRAADSVAALGAASMDASRALLASKRTRRCGGGVKPSTRETPKFKVLKSDAKGMRLRVQLPALRFVPALGGGRTWTELMLHQGDAFGEVGKPALPSAATSTASPTARRSRSMPGRVPRTRSGASTSSPRSPTPRTTTRRCRIVVRRRT